MRPPRQARGGETMKLSIKIFRLGNGYAMYVTPFLPPEILLKHPKEIIGEVLDINHEGNVLTLKIKLHQGEEE